jgi:glycine C-acetyltransferase
MSHALIADIQAQLQTLETEGLAKFEREIVTPQSANITVATGHGPQRVLNMCANNYLGLADHPRLIGAARQAMDAHGFGMASVRFICGTQDIHRALERELAEFLGTEAAILFSSCFDANGGLFEALLGGEDAIISDALNHASIIDGVRLCKARRFRYANNDMAELEARLVEAQDSRHRLVVTDGVFSMDGIVANLPGVCDLAEKYDALVMVDDSHATGFMGPMTIGDCASACIWSPPPSARRWAGPRAALPPGRGRWWTCCVRRRGPICSRIRWPRRLSRRPARRCGWSAPVASCGRSWRPTRRGFARE